MKTIAARLLRMVAARLAPSMPVADDGGPTDYTGQRWSNGKLGGSVVDAIVVRKVLLDDDGGLVMIHASWGPLISPAEAAGALAVEAERVHVAILGHAAAD